MNNSAIVPVVRAALAEIPHELHTSELCHTVEVLAQSGNTDQLVQLIVACQMSQAQMFERFQSQQSAQFDTLLSVLATQQAHSHAAQMQQMELLQALMCQQQPEQPPSYSYNVNIDNRSWHDDHSDHSNNSLGFLPWLVAAAIASMMFTAVNRPHPQPVYIQPQPPNQEVYPL